MTQEPVVLFNLLKVDPARQQALLDLLQQNIDTVVCTLPGWRSSELIAGLDGGSVMIRSDWDSADAMAGMRNDPRMQSYFPKIRELASFETTPGRRVLRRAA